MGECQLAGKPWKYPWETWREAERRRVRSLWERSVISAKKAIEENSMKDIEAVEKAGFSLSVQEEG